MRSVAQALTEYDVAEALYMTAGSTSAAARRLGCSVDVLRAWLAEHGMMEAPAKFRALVRERFRLIRDPGTCADPAAFTKMS